MKETMKQPRFEYLWRNKWITSNAETIDDMIEGHKHFLNELIEFKKAGLEIDPCSDVSGDYIWFYTNDKELADSLGFYEIEDEEDYEDEDCEEGEDEF